MEASSNRQQEDLRLASAAAGGSIADWHEFVLRYSGLILSIVRRYLYGFDQDTQRSTYVDILESFFRTGLARYDGRTRMSTWVITVTRSKCLDALRSAHGRSRPPNWLRPFSDRDREIYRLYFIECLDPGAVAEMMRRRGQPVEQSEIEATLQRLDTCIDRRGRTRLAYELQARSSGRVSARLLEYLDHVRQQIDAQQRDFQPDERLIEEEARDLLSRVRAGFEQLPEAERTVLELRFQSGLPASHIASRMGLSSRHSAQALIKRAIVSLRRNLNTRNGGPKPRSRGRTDDRGRTP